MTIAFRFLFESSCNANPVVALATGRELRFNIKSKRLSYDFSRLHAKMEPQHTIYGVLRRCVDRETLGLEGPF